MANSIRSLANDIDPLYPLSPLYPENNSLYAKANSLRALAQRFRYTDLAPGSLPQGPLSLRQLCARTAGEDVRRLEFLSYNTWLLRDSFRVADVVKGAVDLPRLPACLGLSAVDLLASILEEAGSAISDVCDKLFPPVFSICGVSVNPLNDACHLLGDLTSFAAWLIDVGGLVLEAILDILQIATDFFIDIVFRLAGYFIPVDLHLVDKPDLDTRLPEIAREVALYDVVALCEVWRPEFRTPLLAGNPGRPAYIGPEDPGPGDWAHLGSGLLVFSPTRPIANGGAHRYATAGVRRPLGGCEDIDVGALVDADKFARKGVQLTLVDVGVGFVEVYSTHLYSGGDMPDALNELFIAPLDQEKRDIRQAQLQEFADFIAATHTAQHIAIVCGDFNIGAADYSDLQALLTDDGLPAREGPIHFDDWYDVPMQAALYPPSPEDSGHTSRPDDGDNKYAGDYTLFASSFGSHCKPFVAMTPNQRPRSAHDDYYCDEAVAADANAVGGRIDYILVQRPVDAHTFNLDVSRVRRRAFARPTPLNGTQMFMSDHVGS